MVIPVSGYTDAYSKYIEDYRGIAVEQQESYGIPASITLAQGLLESRAGQSTLASIGNNHFGIKCHKSWTGDTLLRNDDEINECFRAYASALESFEDHSKFLSTRRYRPLFENDVTDYVAWAHGLKACGYATDPNYAMRLISIIERYGLYQFDSNTDSSMETGTDFIHQSLKSIHPIRRTRGLHCVIASPGDTYSSIAKELCIDPLKLMSMNDVDKDCEIKPWEEVYLQPKHETAPENLSRATIGEGESIHSISQRFGMKMSTLLSLNPHVKDQPGNTLRLK